MAPAGEHGEWVRRGIGDGPPANSAPPATEVQVLPWSVNRSRSKPSEAKKSPFGVTFAPMSVPERPRLVDFQDRVGVIVCITQEVEAKPVPTFPAGP